MADDFICPDHGDKSVIVDHGDVVCSVECCGLVIKTRCFDDYPGLRPLELPTDQLDKESIEEEDDKNSDEYRIPQTSEVLQLCKVSEETLAKPSEMPELCTKGKFLRVQNPKNLLSKKMIRKVFTKFHVKDLVMKAGCAVLCFETHQHAVEAKAAVDGTYCGSIRLSVAWTEKRDSEKEAQDSLTESRPVVLVDAVEAVPAVKAVPAVEAVPAVKAVPAVEAVPALASPLLQDDAVAVEALVV